MSSVAITPSLLGRVCFGVGRTPQKTDEHSWVAYLSVAASSVVQLIDKVDVRLWSAIAPTEFVLGYRDFSVVVAVSRGADGDVVVAAGCRRGCGRRSAVAVLRGD